MKIGFDITDLYVAQAGVFYYRYNLIKAMLQLDLPQHEFMLLDYYPIHGGWVSRPEVDALAGPQTELCHVRGLRHRKLSRLGFLQKPGLAQIAHGIDKLLLFPWGMLANTVMNHQLHKYLDGIEVFHSSEVLNYVEPHAKTVATIYDMTTYLFPEYHTAQTIALQKEKFRFAKEKADAIIAISESTKQDAVKYLGIEPERIHVVYAGVDPAFHPLPNEEVVEVLTKYHLQPESYILHVSTIEPRKNLVRLIEAYHTIWQRRPQSTPKLVLAGGAGWFFREVFGKIESLGLTKQVVFLGRVDDLDLPALYNGALFLAYPTLYEGFGMPALEAMACGTAVLTSNVSSLPEVVGEAGYLVAPKEIDSIIAGLNCLIDNTEQRNTLFREGQLRAKTFSWRRAAQQTVGVYEKVNHI